MRKETLYAFGIAFILWGLAGCGLWSSSSKSNDAGDPAYQAGMKALQQKQYDQAIQKFRDVEPNSPMYGQALQMIQKIPYARGKEAFDQKQYKLAVIELDKIPKTHPEHQNAQRLKSKALYELTLLQYRQAKGDQLPLLRRLVESAAEANDPQMAAQVVNLLVGHLQKTKQATEVKATLELLNDLLDRQTSPEALDAGLEQLYALYPQWYPQVSWREALLQTIQHAKVKLVALGQ